MSFPVHSQDTHTIHINTSRKNERTCAGLSTDQGQLPGHALLKVIKPRPVLYPAAGAKLKLVVLSEKKRRNLTDD